MLWIKGIIFTILIPGTVAGFAPHWLTMNRIPDVNLGYFRWVGIVLMIIGIIIYLLTAISFLLRGKGTPAIWFTRAIGFIIGEEPVKMVSSGLYKYSRNPMYIGVMTVVAGEGLFFQYSILLYYVLILFMMFHLVVVFIEEPHLENKFGKEYKEFKKRTRRWL
jgi:protein-S-isoprenylcysteine O-methyltransferase Ste14